MQAFEEPYDNVDIEETPWLFVQYSSGPSNVSYSIINICGTVWQEDNLYRNVVAYIKEGEAVYQAIIIRKSKDRNKLDAELRSMKDCCLTTDFPISGTSCVSSRQRIEQILHKHVSSRRRTERCCVMLNIERNFNNFVVFLLVQGFTTTVGSSGSVRQTSYNIANET